MVLSPEHGLVDELTSEDQQAAVAAYREQAARKSDLERTELAKEKTGVFIGAHAINLVNGERIPIWIADYVLSTYGTGAIMAVPAHDSRDLAFAENFNYRCLRWCRHLRVRFHRLHRSWNEREFRFSGWHGHP